MRLMEEPRPEDLEVVEYWVQGNSRAWATNENNVPLDSDGNPFILDANGIPTHTMTKDPQEDEEVDYSPSTSDTELPERLVFKLKMLLGRDHNAITQAMIQTKTRSGGKRNRGKATVETDIDLAKSVNLKLQKAIVEWSGMTDESGKPAPITPENIDLLPAWIQNDLVDRVNDMSEISEEELGE